MYPSILLAHNVSPDRLVRQDNPDEVAASKQTGVVVTAHQVSEHQTVLLAEPSVNPGVPYFRRTLEKLLSERAAVRKLLKTETDPAKRAILDARQKSKKVACNSAYGLLGAKKGYLPLPDLAAVTTYQGRQALQFSKRIAEEKYGARTIAGDSVAAYTPVYMWYQNMLHIVTISSLPQIFACSEWIVCSDGKEICHVEDGIVSTWTDAGWTPLRSIIRHRLGPAKQMFRVLTESGVVDVSEDHSLLTQDGTAVRTSEVSIGNQLLHANLPPPCNTSDHSRPSDNLLVDTYDMAHDCNCVPFQVINGSAHVRRAYIRGCTDGGHQMDLSVTAKQSAQIRAAHLLWMFHSIGRRARFSICSSQSGKTQIDFRSADRVSLDVNPPGQILAIRPIVLPPDSYIYDLTTDNHHFAAGVGNMIVHNTDSIMITLPAQPGVATPEIPDAEWLKHRMKYVFEHGEHIGDDISSQLPPELVFELEGT